MISVLRNLLSWRRCAGIAMLFGLTLSVLIPRSAIADSVYVDVVAIKGEVKNTNLGVIHLVDSWFTTLATLGFDLKGLPPGLLDVKLHVGVNCDTPGPVYNPYEVAGGEYRIGDLLRVLVRSDGSLMGKHGVKPPTLNANTHKITVTEMRGHTLVFASRGNHEFRACGQVREGEFEPTR